MERSLPTESGCPNLEKAKGLIAEHMEASGENFTVSQAWLTEGLGDELEVIGRLEAVTLHHGLGAEHTVGIAVVDCLSCQGTGCYPILGANTPKWAVKAIPQMLRQMYGPPTAESFKALDGVQTDRKEAWETAAAVAQQTDTELREAAEAEEAETDG